jgi:1,4-alpha-glucan branching enzyme
MKALTPLMLALAVACTNAPAPEAQPQEETPSVWLPGATIYEVNLRQFTPEGTINAFRTHLPRLQKLGVEVLWIMPIQPIGVKNRKGDLGSYYSISNYTQVNPEFGTMDDFKALVQEAHTLGMEVILDWVANHTAWDHPWMTEHPDWYTRDSSGAVIPPVPDWSDVADLNYDQPAMRAEMLKSMQFWLREANIDGFRCDVAMMVPLDFWKQVRDSLEAIKPVFMLAEAEGPEYFKNGFDMDYAWELHHLMNQVAQGKAEGAVLAQYLKKQDSVNAPTDLRMAFTTNHDENSWNGTAAERMGPLRETMFVLAATFPQTMPLVYSGQEAGETHRLRFFAKDTIRWADTSLVPFYQQALALKKIPALQNRRPGTTWGTLPMEGNALAYWRKSDTSTAVMAFNFTAQPLVLAVQDSTLTGTYTAFDGAKVELKPGQQLVVGAHGYLVLTR